MNSKPDNSKAEQEYAPGYDSDITLKYHGSRTANTHASWFLPYLQPGMTLLDVGCASGSITFGLAKVVEPGQVTGVDISEADINRARERATKNKISNIHFEVANAYQLDFSDNSFDALFSHNVLEHIPEPSRALQEMRRVLKPSGVIGIRNVDYEGLLFAPDNEIRKKATVFFEADWKNVGGHPRIGRQLGRLFHDAGLVEIKVSASFDVHSDVESRRLYAQSVNSMFSSAEYIKRVTEAGLAKVEEFQAFTNWLLKWQEIPWAFAAIPHCEAIGRKA